MNPSPVNFPGPKAGQRKQPHNALQSMHRNRTRTLALALGVGLLTLAPVHAAETGKPKYSIEEIMKALHKGDDAVGKRVGKGQGTKADFAKLVEYYPSLALNKPPKGDLAAWKSRSNALLAAAKALNSGEDGALERYKKAVNCKACHSEHREDKDHK